MVCTYAGLVKCVTRKNLWTYTLQGLNRTISDMHTSLLYNPLCFV